MAKTNQQSEINPENIGKIFSDGENYYKLLSCEAEPQAVFSPLDGGEAAMTGGVSTFSRLVLMAPVREVKAPRADLGGKHTRRQRTPANPTNGTQTVTMPANNTGLSSTRSCPTHPDQTLTRKYDGTGWECPLPNCTYQELDEVKA